MLARRILGQLYDGDDERDAKALRYGGETRVCWRVRYVAARLYASDALLAKTLPCLRRVYAAIDAAERMNRCRLLPPASRLQSISTSYYAMPLVIVARLPLR